MEETKELKGKKVKYIKLKEKVTFNTGTTILTEKGKQALKEVSEEIKGTPKERLLIEGHTDNVGEKEENQKLSEDRALETAKILIRKYGVKNKIAITGKGDKEPIADNETEEGRAKNRRVEFIIITEE